MSEQYVEYIGYLAMTLVGLSFLMSNIKALRILNILGATVFVIYGLNLKDPQPPIYILNSFIILVNLYYVFIKKPDKK